MKDVMHPMRRFLGLDPDSDPLDILGVSVAEIDEESIRTALKERESQIADHPDGESDEAWEARAESWGRKVPYMYKLAQSLLSDTIQEISNNPVRASSPRRVHSSADEVLKV